MNAQPGLLALVGGEELTPGNEAVDHLLVAGAEALGRDRPAFVIVTAAARFGPDDSVEHAAGWFGRLGLPVEELPLRRRGQGSSTAVIEAARTGRFFYLVGGDPGYLVRTLAGTGAWEAIVDAWRGGAVLAGSSAGAMAFGEWTLIRSRMPGDTRRRALPALGLVPGIAVIPHFDRFGGGWVESAGAALPGGATLLGIDERTAAVWSTDAGWRAMGPGLVRVMGAGRRLADLPAPR